MSIKAMNFYWESEDKLSQGELLVLLALADWSNDEGVCFPGQKRLARKTRYSYEGVRDALSRLIGKGEVVALPRFVDSDGERRQTSNFYYLARYRTSIGLTSDPTGFVEIDPSTSENTGGVVSTHQGGGANRHQPRTTSKPTTSSELRSSEEGGVPPYAMVMGYFVGLEQAGRAVDRKGFKRWLKAGKSALEMGYTPDEVKAETFRLATQDKFWLNKPLPLERVVEHLALRRKERAGFDKEVGSLDKSYDPFGLEEGNE